MSLDDQNTSSIIGDTNACNALFLKVLLARGWKLENGVAIASKEYQSAVGLKKAFVYASGVLLDYVVSAEYQSQGRNILSTSSVLIQKALTEAEVDVLANTFAEKIDAIIADSYAVRLYLSSLKDEAEPITLTAKGFVFNGVEVRNPTLSLCGRFTVNPKDAYGFNEVSTGGGCTALQLDVHGGGYVWLTDGNDSCVLPTEINEPFAMGFFDNEGLEIAFHTLKVGENYSDDSTETC